MTATDSQTAPPAEPETTVTILWPTIGATAVGRIVGRLAGVPIGLGPFLTLGKLLAVLTIPVSLGVFVWQLLPYVARRYRLTDRRIIVEKGLSACEERSIGLDQFDAIEVEVLPGQAWLRAGDLVFRRDGRDVFRLPGVCRPEIFRRVCLEARAALVSVREVLQERAERKSSRR